MNALAAPTEFSTAYRAHWPRAFSSAFRVLGDAAAAEDVVQDVFLTLWRNPGLFDPARGNLGGYVAMMARSRAVDRVRSIRRRAGAPWSVSGCVTRTGPATTTAPAPPPSGARSAGGSWPRSRTCRPSQRDAVLMAFGKGLSAAEIAEASDTPLGTAKSRLRLGLEKTREKLDAAA